MSITIRMLWLHPSIALFATWYQGCHCQTIAAFQDAPFDWERCREIMDWGRRVWSLLRVLSYEPAGFQNRAKPYYLELAPGYCRSCIYFSVVKASLILIQFNPLQLAQERKKCGPASHVHLLPVLSPWCADALRNTSFGRNGIDGNQRRKTLMTPVLRAHLNESKRNGSGSRQRTM